MAVMLAPVDIEVELLSLPEAARVLDVSHVQFWRLVRANKIKVIQVGTTPGRKVVYGVRREALNALLEERRRPRPD